MDVANKGYEQLPLNSYYGYDTDSTNKLVIGAGDGDNNIVIIDISEEQSKALNTEKNMKYIATAVDDGSYGGVAGDGIADKFEVESEDGSSSTEVAIPKGTTVLMQKAPPPETGPTGMQPDGSYIAPESGDLHLNLGGDSGYRNTVYVSLDNGKTWVRAGIDGDGDVKIGYVDKGTKVLFKVDNGHGDTYQTGSDHFKVDDSGTLCVEDLRNFGDRDFSDVLITASVQEP